MFSQCLSDLRREESALLLQNNQLQVGVMRHYEELMLLPWSTLPLQYSTTYNLPLITILYLLRNNMNNIFLTSNI